MAFGYTLRVIFRLRRYRPDSIHCMNVYTLHIGYLAGKLLGVPYVYDSHDLFIGQGHMVSRPALVRRVSMMYEKFFAKRAAVVIQDTKSRGRCFQKLYGIETAVVMNKALSAGPGEVLHRCEHPALRTDKKKLVYVGFVMPGRGIEALVEATLPLRDVQVFLLGNPSGPAGQALLDKYKEYVAWIPAVPPGQVTAALKAFDLGVSLVENCCLSYYYSCPTKVWELIVAGVPQVASDFPEIRKLIVHNPVGPVGAVVDPADVLQIRAKIRQILDSPEMLNTYRENCLKLRSFCLWQTEGQKLLGIYSGIVGTPATQPEQVLSESAV
jgi:glycosyltransferase involved in cell wall biosynthesis